MTRKPWNKVLLIVPPTGKYIREERCQTPLDELHTIALRPPMDLLYLAAALERMGTACRVEDYPAHDLGWEQLQADLRQYRPDALILSITTPSLADDMRAAALAKTIDAAIVTVSKGAHFQCLDRRSLEEYPQLDLVIRGEYEETVCELASGSSWDAIAGITYRDGASICRNPDRGFIEEIDTIPYPARHLIDNTPYRRPDTGELQTTIATSRGCPFPCVFCLARVVSGAGVRCRSPQNVIGELRECAEKYGIRNFLFRSDLFTANKRWVLSLCEAIRQEKLDIEWACNSRVDTVNEEMLREMKAAGCWLISFGVESGDPEMLEKMRKQVRFETIEPAIRLCRRAGLKSSVYFLIGLPWESRETFETTKRFAQKLNPDFIEFFYSYPFYGTEFYDVAVKEGLLREGELPKAAYNHPAVPTRHLSLEELAPLRREALRSFYMRPGYILRTLARTRSPRVLKNYVIFGLRQLRDLLGPGR